MSKSPSDVDKDAKSRKEDTNTTFVTNIYSKINDTSTDDNVPNDDGGYISIPLFVLFGILILSALVYLMARNRRKHLSICTKRYKRFRYDSSYDEDAALLKNDEFDDPSKHLLNGKLEIENRYDT